MFAFFKRAKLLLIRMAKISVAGGKWFCKASFISFVKQKSKKCECNTNRCLKKKSIMDLCNTFSHGFHQLKKIIMHGCKQSLTYAAICLLAHVHSEVWDCSVCRLRACLYQNALGYCLILVWSFLSGQLQPANRGDQRLHSKWTQAAGDGEGSCVTDACVLITEVLNLWQKCWKIT